MVDIQRSISISVLTSRPALAEHVHDVFLEYAKELRPLDLDYINVNSSRIDEEIEVVEEPTTAETEYHGVGTLPKVIAAIMATGLSESKAREVLRSMQQYGILFRERRRP